MASESPVRLSGKHLLIVDDDESFCRVLERAMSRRGFAIEVAHSVDQAWKLAQMRPPDYAIVDLNMPGLSGMELVTRLTSLKARTRILVLTGFASISTAGEAIRSGATRYLAKPVDADEITAALLQED